MNTKNPILRIKPLGFQWETSDPFLFCVHHQDQYPAGTAQMGIAPELLQGRQLGNDFIPKDGFRMYHGQTVPGFPGHPHRGFETVTVVLKGTVDHADSQGAAGRYADGDVQWMTAGAGLQHSEMFPLLHSDAPNPVELFQIWLNLPKKSKLVPPHFKMLWREEIPIYRHRDAQQRETQIRIIAGTIDQVAAPTPPPNSWAADAANGVAIWNIELSAHAQFSLPAAEAGLHRTLYFYRGTGLSVAEVPIPVNHGVELKSDSTVLLQAGESAAFLLLLQGRPIAEPVVQYGPFVMNSQEEIQQTFREFQRTKFGGWPWKSYDQVHEQHKGRFAKHADGRVEEMG